MFSLFFFIIFIYADVTPSVDDETIKKMFVGLWYALWEVRWTGMVSLLTFVTTLAIFPSMLVLVVPQNINSNGAWESELLFDNY